MLKGFAQNQTDVFRISNDMAMPSARAQGMGGAFGAIGADPSSVFTNPAGMGVYKTSVVDFGLSMLTRSQKSSFESVGGTTSQSDMDAKLSIDHFTWVRSYPTRSADWKMFNIGLSHGKMIMYQRSFEISANTNGTSLLDAFSSQAQGVQYDELANQFPFTSELAWQTYGMDTLPGTMNTYYSNYYGGNVQQNQKVEQDGMKTDFSGVFSANYRDQLFLGVSLSLQSCTFSEVISHTELYPDPLEILQQMQYSSNLKVSASAAQLRWGVIWIPERYPWARLGFAYHSGANFYCTDRYDTEMSTQFVSSNFNYSSPQNSVNYYMRVPRKWQLNSAFNVGDRWLVGMDIEHINFSRGTISGTNENTYDYKAENDLVKAQGNSSFRVRMGAECRVVGGVRARFGWDYQSSPFSQWASASGWHAGMGYRGERFFVDGSLSLSQQSQNWYLYNSSLIAPAQIQSFQTLLRFSIGWRLSDFHQEEDKEELKPNGAGTGDF